MSLIAILIAIFVFLGFGAFSTESTVEVSTVEVATATVYAPPAPGWSLVNFDGFRGVIVAEDDADGFGITAPTWTPTEADVQAAEEAIAEQEGDLTHHRQYVGIVEDGDEKILVNGFCTDEPTWMSEPVIVMDGGDCFFTAIYNVQSGELESFRFNGDA